MTIIDSADLTREEEAQAIDRVDALVLQIEDLIEGDPQCVVLTTMAHIVASSLVQAVANGCSLGETGHNFMALVSDLMRAYADALVEANRKGMQ